MSGDRQVKVPHRRKGHRGANRGARPGNRRCEAEGSARRCDPQGLVYVRRGPVARLVSSRARAPGRVLSPIKLFEGDGVDRLGENPPRYRLLGARPRRSSRRRHSRIGSDAGVRQGSPGRPRRPSRFICVMLEKPGKRAVKIDADFVGFVCPDLFVVGYGMDVAHCYRELPFIGHVVTAKDAA